MPEFLYCKNFNLGVGWNSLMHVSASGSRQEELNSANTQKTHAAGEFRENFFKIKPYHVNVNTD